MARFKVGLFGYGISLNKSGLFGDIRFAIELSNAPYGNWNFSVWLGTYWIELGKLQYK